MFKVFHKYTGKVYAVYGVSGLRFVAWDPLDKQWLFLLIEDCEPVVEG